MLVICLSFADANTFASAREKICMLIEEAYRRYDFLLTGGSLKEGEAERFRKVLVGMTDSELAYSFKNLSGYYGKSYYFAGRIRYASPGSLGIRLLERDGGIYQGPVQFHIQGEPVSGAGDYDGNHEGQQGIHFKIFG